MNIFTRSERIAIEDGQLVRIVTAHGKDKAHINKSMDVLRQLEDGTKFIRNMEYQNIAGWRIVWPGTHYTTYCGGYNCGSFLAELDPWYKTTYKFKGFCESYPDESDKEKVLKLYPNFKWIFQKSKLTISEIFHVLPMWKQNPQQVELLLSAGYKYLALNANLYKMKDSKKILNWLRKNPGLNSVCLYEIQACIKWGIDLKEFCDYKYDNERNASLEYDCWKWCKEKGNNARIYHDYLQIAEKLGHDLNDKYWRFPSDLKKAHDKVMRQMKRKQALEEKAERERKQVSYMAAIEKIKGYELVKNKIKVFVPETISQIEHQAKVLHQCLIHADYVKKVADGKCFLIFVLKNGKPYATCELIRNGKKLRIGQFYGDEQKSDYKAKTDAKEAMNEWAKKFKIKLAA